MNDYHPFCDGRPVKRRRTAEQTKRRRKSGQRTRRTRLLARPERRVCSYCRRKATTWDHVDARSVGGQNVQDNLVPACGRCNSRKGSMSLVLFLAQRARERHRS